MRVREWKARAENIVPDLLNVTFQPWFGGTHTRGLTAAVPQSSVKLLLRCLGISKIQHHPLRMYN